MLNRLNATDQFSGETIGYVTINRNITEHKLAEEALHKSEEQLSNSDKHW